VEEDEGEALLENVQHDYQRIDALDTYGTEGMDYAEYDIDPEHREAAEQELARRDNKAGRRQDGFYGLLDTVEDEEDEEARMARRGNFRREEAEEDVTDEEDFDGEDQVNLEAFEVPLREWIAQDRTRIEIQRRFRAFCGILHQQQQQQTMRTLLVVDVAGTAVDSKLSSDSTLSSLSL
jgi:DNA replication licensing factor MCM2